MGHRVCAEDLNELARRAAERAGAKRGGQRGRLVRYGRSLAWAKPFAYGRGGEAIRIASRIPVKNRFAASFANSSESGEMKVVLSGAYGTPSGPHNRTMGTGERRSMSTVVFRL